MPARSIAIVVPDLAVGGGVATVARFLFRVLADSRDFTPTLISIATGRSDRASVQLLAPSTWVRGVQVIRENCRGLAFVHVGCLFSEVEVQRYRARGLLSRVLQEHDVVQIVCGTPAWALAAKDCGRPVCLQTASLAVIERRSLLASARGPRAVLQRTMTRLTARMDTLALRHVDTAFVENHWMQDHVRRYLPAENVLLAPPGIDTALFCPSGDPSREYILSVGRFCDPRKNVRLLFTAYSQLRGPAVPDLVLVGRSPAPEDLAYAEKLGVLAKVRIYTGVSERELTCFYRDAAFLVLSSDEEGFGMVILEAMACGVPVISTRCGGPEMLVRDAENGFLTPVGDAAALALHMRELLSNKTLCRSMGARSRAIAETLFSLEVTGKPFLDRYAMLARKS